MGTDSADHYLIYFLIAWLRKLDPVILHASKTKNGKCMSIPRRTSHRLAFSW
jgi:hypothetical protein